MVYIESNFCIHTQEQFHFLFQMDDCAAMQGVSLASQGLELWVAKSPCTPYCREECAFLLTLSFSGCQR